MRCCHADIDQTFLTVSLVLICCIASVVLQKVQEISIGAQSVPLLKSSSVTRSASRSRLGMRNFLNAIIT